MLGKVCSVMLEITIMHLKTNNTHAIIFSNSAEVRELW